MMTELQTVIITGGNTGLGYACAQHILTCYHNRYVVIACRNEDKAKKAVEKLIAETGNRNIGFLQLDLASFQSVRAFVSAFLQGGYALYGIVCNAGIALGDEITTTADGIETTFQVNCLGHFLLVHLLLPYLNDQGSMVMVSSELHRNDGPMPSFRPNFTDAREMAYPLKPVSPIKDWGSRRYAATKLCLLFYTYELAERLAKDNNRRIRVNAFNPGLMPDTGLGGLNKMFFTRFFLKYVLPFFAKGAVSTPAVSGRILAELLLDDKYKGITGKYFDRDKLIPSSEESYDRAKWTDLWEWSAKIVGLTK